jgi:RimJ/RimL family protein N-acetyltransferase
MDIRRATDFFVPRRPRILRGPFIEHPVTAPLLRTNRLVLRPHRMEDARLWWEIENQRTARRYLGWPVRDHRRSRVHLRHRTRHTCLRQADDFLALAVERDGRLIGDVSLHLRSTHPESRAAEIGWLFDERVARQGYATEAASAMLALAFELLEAKWVFAVSHPSNERSIGLAQRLGFVPAAITDRHATLLLTSVAWGRRGSELQRDFGIQLPGVAPARAHAVAVAR